MESASPKTLEFCRVTETTLGPRFSQLAPPGSKVPVNGDTLPHSNTAESIPEASPPIRDGSGVVRAARIVTSTKLGNRPIGPTAHSQRCENAGKTRPMESSLRCSVW
jgi:hypothetical protein